MKTGDAIKTDDLLNILSVNSTRFKGREYKMTPQGRIVTGKSDLGSIKYYF